MNEQVAEYLSEKFDNIIYLKDFKYLKKYIILDPRDKEHRTYRRFKIHGDEEHLIGYAGYSANNGAADKPDMYGRILMENTVTHRQAIHMKRCY